jgi:hypothetical protein
MKTATTVATADSETLSLIGSDKVEGTAVYDMAGDRVGKIERVMIDKFSGYAAYAVMTFGGFLGIGEDHYPLPWSMLKYDESLDGYRVDLDKDQLKDAPKFSGESDFDWADRRRGRSIFNYYGVPPYWV